MSRSKHHGAGAGERRPPRWRLVLLLATFAVVAVSAVFWWWRAARDRDGSADTKKPNLVLITVDTLRADHLGCYGHDRPTSPNIDRLAAHGVRFERALSQAPWTLPAMATVHTALYPSAHGAIQIDAAIAQELPTIAEVLDRAGYATYGVVSHVFVDREHGFAQGFDWFDETNILGHDAVSSRRITRRALQGLRQGSSEPFFLWVHYFDPHFTYVRHEQIGFAANESSELPDRLTWRKLRTGTFDPDDVRYVERVYDEEIAYTDDHVGALLHGIGTLHPERRVVVVFTGDHGEYFMERGRFGHGKDCYRELTHVPLIIGGDIDQHLRGTVVEPTVELAAIPHTLMELARIESHPFDGPSLLDEQAWRGRFRFTEGTYAWGDDQRKSCVVSDRHKLIRHLDDGREELYDRVDDPAETTDLLRSERAQRPEALSRLRAALDRHGAVAKGRGGPDVELSRDDREHLRALGYAE